MLERPRDAASRIIVPLDVPTEAELKRLTCALAGKVGMFKVGKELFTSLGPRAVEMVRDEGGQVFLDLKFHDIPNTVAGAVRAAVRLGVSMLTVHASGGTRMLQAAVQAAAEHGEGVQVVAVTVLTSLDDEALNRMGLASSVVQTVRRLGSLAIGAGVAGLVASAREAPALRKLLGPGPLLVTPGIRPASSSADDQARVVTPGEAVRAGADFLVIGRPITRAPDPAGAAEAIAAELAG